VCWFYHQSREYGGLASGAYTIPSPAFWFAMTWSWHNFSTALLTVGMVVPSARLYLSPNAAKPEGAQQTRTTHAIQVWMVTGGMDGWGLGPAVVAV
jgi:hypothetical protein